LTFGLFEPLAIMTRRLKVILYIGCVLAVLAFQYSALVWSFADFHPGGDVEPDATLTKTAELGAAMHRPFRLPLDWMQEVAVRVTGGYGFVSSPVYSRLYSAVHWLVLPLLYASALYALLRIASPLFRGHPESPPKHNRRANKAW
jgi:hypothetical protein